MQWVKLARLEQPEAIAIFEGDDLLTIENIVA
jgi:hypothetical protein